VRVPPRAGAAPRPVPSSGLQLLSALDEEIHTLSASYPSPLLGQELHHPGAPPLLAHAEHRERHPHRLLEALGEPRAASRPPRARTSAPRPLLAHRDQLVGEQPEDVEQEDEPLASRRPGDSERQPEPDLLQVLGADQASRCPSKVSLAMSAGLSARRQLRMLT
jgi:hypothetical protein